MAMTSTIFPVKSALLLVAAILCNALTAAEEPNEDDNEPKQKWHVISSEESSDFPLISVGGESCLTLDLYDMETRKLNMSLKNITKAPVKIMGIIPGCPCLSLQAPIENATVEPNASLPVNFTINSRKLKPGKFYRFFYVQLDGRELPAKLPVKGEIKELLKYSPNKVIQLGTFVGDVPWSRTFTIESTLEPDKITIKQPEIQQRLKVEVQKESPTTFKVVVSSQGKLPAKKLKEVIELPVEGIPNYGPAEVALVGVVTGWDLTLEKEAFVLAKNRIDHEKTTVIETKMILRSDKTAKPTRRHRSNAVKNDNPLITIQTVADNEEKQVHPLSSPDTWKSIMNDVSIDNIPENVTIEKTPSDGGIILKITLPPGFFKSSSPFLNLPVKVRGNTISMLKVSAK